MIVVQRARAVLECEREAEPAWLSPAAVDLGDDTIDWSMATRRSTARKRTMPKAEA